MAGAICWPAHLDPSLWASIGGNARLSKHWVLRWPIHVPLTFAGAAAFARARHTRQSSTAARFCRHGLAGDCEASRPRVTKTRRILKPGARVIELFLKAVVALGGVRAAPQDSATGRRYIGSLQRVAATPIQILTPQASDNRCTPANQVCKTSASPARSAQRSYANVKPDQDWPRRVDQKQQDRRVSR